MNIIKCVLVLFLNVFLIISTIYLECNVSNLIYQSHLILTELFQHNLMNVFYLTACHLYQVMMTLHFLSDVANDAESMQK